MTLILPRKCLGHDEWKVYADGQGISFSDYPEQFLDPKCQSKKVHYLGGLNIT